MYLANLTTQPLDAILEAPPASASIANAAKAKAASACVRHARAFAAVAAARSTLPSAATAVQSTTQDAAERVPRLRQHATDFLGPATDALNQRAQLAQLATATDTQAAPLLELPALVDLAASQGRYDVALRLAEHLAGLLAATAPTVEDEDGKQKDRHAGAAVLRALMGTVVATLSEVQDQLVYHLARPTPSVAPARKALSTLSHLSTTTAALTEALDKHVPAAGVEDLRTHLRALHLPLPALALAYARTQYAGLAAKLEALPLSERSVRGKAQSCGIFIDAFRDSATASLRLGHTLFLSPDLDTPTTSRLHARAIFSSLAESWTGQLATRVEQDVKVIVRSALACPPGSHPDVGQAGEAARLLADLHRRVRYAAVPLRPLGADPLPRIAAGSLAQAPRKILQTLLGAAHARFTTELGQSFDPASGTWNRVLSGEEVLVMGGEEEEEKVLVLSQAPKVVNHHNAVLDALDVLGTFAPRSTQPGTHAALLASLQSSTTLLSSLLRSPTLALSPEAQATWHSALTSYLHQHLPPKDVPALQERTPWDATVQSEIDGSAARVLLAQTVLSWVRGSVPRIWEGYHTIFAPPSHSTDAPVPGSGIADDTIEGLADLVPQAEQLAAGAMQVVRARLQERKDALRAAVEQLQVEKEQKKEQERIAAEKAEAERQEAQARVEAEARERAEREAKEARVRAEQERIEAERRAQEAAERKEQERVEAERQAQLEAERAAREAEEKERRAKIEAERAEQERIENERKAKEAAERAAREETERLERVKLEQERAEAERIERGKREAERLEKERIERERFAKEKAKQERLAKEQAQQDRLATEKADQERIEAERVAKEQAEKERLEAERIAKEEAEEKERIAKEEAEKKRIEQQERLEAERVAQEQAEKEQAQEAKAEQERIQAERKVQEDTERAAKDEAANVTSEQEPTPSTHAASSEEPPSADPVPSEPAPSEPAPSQPTPSEPQPTSAETTPPTEPPSQSEKRTPPPPTAPSTRPIQPATPSSAPTTQPEQPFPTSTSAPSVHSTPSVAGSETGSETGSTPETPKPKLSLKDKLRLKQEQREKERAQMRAAGES